MERGACSSTLLAGCLKPVQFVLTMHVRFRIQRGIMCVVIDSCLIIDCQNSLSQYTLALFVVGGFLAYFFLFA